MPQVAILADDLTGAADAGVTFSEAGFTSLIRLHSGPLKREYEAVDTLIFLTDSRHSSDVETIRRNRQAAEQILALPSAQQPQLIYQKIDSTLRDHPALALATTRQTLGLSLALVAPAFPAQGRTTIRGEQYVQGQRLIDSPFKAEVTEGHLPTLFQAQLPSHEVQLITLNRIRQGPHLLARCLDPADPTTFIADAETKADLINLAQAAWLSNIRLLCGSAGLAQAAAEVYPFKPLAAPLDMPAPHFGPILVVAGSRHPATLGQVAAAQEQGISTIRLPEPVQLAEETWLATTVDRMRAELARSRDIILTTAGLRPIPNGDQQVAAALGEIVRRIMLEVTLGGLVLTGGDIALAVCEGLGVSHLSLQTEVEAGVALGHVVDGLVPGLPLITKAGGFGGQETLLKAVEGLKLYGLP